METPSTMPVCPQCRGILWLGLPDLRGKLYYVCRTEGCPALWVSPEETLARVIPYTVPDKECLC
jgi:hypothetical protein